MRLLLDTAHTDGRSNKTQREQQGGEDFDCNKEEEEEEGNTEKNHNNMEIIPPLPLTAEEEDGGPYKSKQLDHAGRIRSDGIIFPEDKASEMDISWRSRDLNHRAKESSSIDNSLRSYELNRSPMASRRRFHSSASARFREPPLSKEEEEEEDRRTQKSFNQTTEEEVLNNNIKWQKTASRIDDICRLTIPSTYIVLMALILQNASSSP